MKMKQCPILKKNNDLRKLDISPLQINGISITVDKAVRPK